MPVHSPRLFGDIQLTQGGVGGIHFSGEKRYESVKFKVVSVIMRGWIQFPEKKRGAIGSPAFAEVT